MPDPSAPANNLQALSQAVRQRREALCLSRRSVYDVGGPSTTTLNKLENPATTDLVSARTMERLDTALQWTPGTAHNVLASAVTPEAAAQQKRPGFPETADPAQDPLSPWSWILTLAQETITYVLDTYNAPNVDEGLHDRGEKLVRQLSDHYTTLLLESYGGPDTVTPPALQAMIGGSLSAEEPVAGTPEHERWLYRRWLVGIPVDTNAGRRFRQHWRQQEEGRNT